MASKPLAFAVFGVAGKELKNNPSILIVGGNDPTSGAGVALDFRAAQQLKVHGFVAVSALTAQNSKGVSMFRPVGDEIFAAQLDVIGEACMPGAIKVGLVGSGKHVEDVSAAQKRFSCPLVWDPVMKSSSGDDFCGAAFIQRAIDRLGGQITLLTPNIPEAESISQMRMTSREDVPAMAAKILSRGVENVLIKGGHANPPSRECADYFSNARESFWIVKKRRHEGERVRGTGCALSSYVAAALAKGMDLRDAIVLGGGALSNNIKRHYRIGDMRFQSLSGFPSHYSELPAVRYRQIAPEKLRFPRCDTGRLGIYPVVDSADWVERLLNLGIETIQLRVKGLTGPILENEIARAAAVGKKHNARLFINDYWRMAIKYGVYGVHLGQADLLSADLEKISEANLRLGVSTHSHWEVAAAIDIDPSYIALGPIYETTSKRMPFSPQGADMVDYWIRFLDGRWPLVAIGGIDIPRAKELKKTGIGSIAMISAITQAEDYKQAALHFMSLWME